MPIAISDMFQLEPSVYEIIQQYPNTPEAMGQTWSSTSSTKWKQNDNDVCPICMQDMDLSTVRLKECGHTFHLSCLTGAASRKMAFLMCRSPLEIKITPRGHMPTGSLVILLNASLTCAGYQPSSIVLRYIFATGRQRPYHPNPGTRYTGTARVAYVPDTKEGQLLVDRLVEAFQWGLTFCIETSLTSERVDRLSPNLH